MGYKKWDLGCELYEVRHRSTSVSDLCIRYKRWNAVNIHLTFRNLNRHYGVNFGMDRSA